MKPLSIVNQQLGQQNPTYTGATKLLNGSQILFKAWSNCPTDFLYRDKHNIYLGPDKHITISDSQS